MRYSLLLALLLTGCATVVPVKAKFPEIPSELAVECPDLTKLPADTKKLSDVVSNVSGNYSTYYECQARKEAWVEWYKAQKQIYEGVK
jgi:hypothetical protein